MTMNDFDPVPMLEAAGINDFEVDYQNRIIQVSWEDLLKWSRHIIPGDLSKSGLAVAMMALGEYRGWRFKPFRESGSRK